MRFFKDPHSLLDTLPIMYEQLEGWDERQWSLVQVHIGKELEFADQEFRGNDHPQGPCAPVVPHARGYHV